ncbi:MAG TPA: multiheme c-type cytochrome, partial [Urbifossiella sp.]|nr:multiheme c-type cytochrome [Urbifossiella sp.]
MRTNGHARWVVASGLFVAGLAVFAGTFVSPAAAQDPAAVGDLLLPQKADDYATGYAKCAQCHPTDPSVDVAKTLYAKNYGSHKFVRLNEGVTWIREDPHSKAHEVLQTPLGRKMSDLLKYDVGASPKCLTCHGIDIAPGLKPEEKKAEHFETANGITCNACHGLRPAWQSSHTDEKKGTMPWRLFTPEVKRKDGLRNLRDPHVRAELCASCHVGSAAAGKLVTHDMYAAGHPPLPPFELATFMESQPRHWGYPTEKELTFFTQAGAEK